MALPWMGARAAIACTVAVLVVGCKLVAHQDGAGASGSASVAVPSTPVEPVTPGAAATDTGPVADGVTKGTGAASAAGAVGTAATAGDLLAKKPPAVAPTATPTPTPAAPPAGKKCSSTDDCAANEACEGGACVTKCAPSAVFIDTHRCSTQTCKSNDDCPTGKSCIPSAHKGVSVCK